VPDLQQYSFTGGGRRVEDYSGLLPEPDMATGRFKFVCAHCWTAERPENFLPIPKMPANLELEVEECSEQWRHILKPWRDRVLKLDIMARELGVYTRHKAFLHKVSLSCFLFVFSIFDSVFKELVATHFLSRLNVLFLPNSYHHSGILLRPSSNYSTILRFVRV
jgi:hypothetical protein